MGGTRRFSKTAHQPDSGITIRFCSKGISVLPGHATAEGTFSLSQQHPEFEYREIGATGLQTSQAGFGSYRISVGVPHHQQAIETALLAGINLIDTSANYADGGSEALIGQVLQHLSTAGKIARSGVIVVSKVGYLQGKNYILGQNRKAEGRPFEDLIDFGEGLAHCIHPDFLIDQLDRSLSRLGLETIDFYLLHNPEYYLEWAKKNRIDLDTARSEYYRRIQIAFEHLETEVSNGRIQYYGVSSNTFPMPQTASDFTSFDRLQKIAGAVSGDHHFKLIQLPLNLLEPGAATEKNQPGDKTALQLATTLKLGVLVNRPLNAFSDTGLFRLADVKEAKAYSTDEVIRSISTLTKSEQVFWHRHLPALGLQLPLQNRIKEQLAVGSILKHHWRNFSTFDRWRDVSNGNLTPRVRGVMEFLTPYADTNEALATWMADHQKCFDRALATVGAGYAAGAARKSARIKRLAAHADPAWHTDGTLSQTAIRAIRSTQGVTSVLVGMRRPAYVADVLVELKRPVSQKERSDAWKKLLP